MSITVRVVMNGRLRAAVKNSQERALRNSGLEIERSMKQLLSNSGGSSHTPSAPGTPPNRQHGELRSSVQSAVSSGGNSVLAGATARYARIQDKGGTVRPKVTARMKRWAWFMFRKTGVAMYRGLALTRKTQLTIVLPPRPYVRPSLMAALPKIPRHWKGMLRK